jgi:PIN domain nuclease of toxin-antitoxin system
MRLLLDTHIFLWYLAGDAGLRAETRDLLRDPVNQVFLSPVSIWEALVKNQLGKLPLPDEPGLYLCRQRVRHGISSLDLDEASVRQLVSLPRLHRDPFDRLLICQALCHGMTLVTVDELIWAYPVETIGC